MFSVTPLTLGDMTIGGGSPFVLIAGPCVIESEAHALGLAGRLVEIARRTRVSDPEFRDAERDDPPRPDRDRKHSWRTKSGRGERDIERDRYKSDG